MPAEPARAGQPGGTAAAGLADPHETSSAPRGPLRFKVVRAARHALYTPLYNRVALRASRDFWARRCAGVEAYIFCANTGRCGSLTLTNLLQQVPGMVAFHESQPSLSYQMMYYPARTPRWRYLWQLRRTDPEAYYREAFTIDKLRRIHQDAAGHRFYADTSHMFLKTYFHHAIDYFGDRLRVIHLRREPLKTISSTHDVGSIPGKGPGIFNMGFDPMDPGHCIQIDDLLRTPEYSHDYCRCIWYWYEIETRISRYKAQFPQLRWPLIRTEELDDVGAFVRLCGELGLPCDGSQIQIVTDRHTRTDEKARRVQAGVVDSGLSPAARQELHDALLAQMVARYGEEFWTKAGN